MSCRLIELGDDLLTAVALPRVHDQVVPNTTFVEHWKAGAATFYFPEDEIQVCTMSQDDCALCTHLIADVTRLEGSGPVACAPGLLAALVLKPYTS